MGRTPGGDDGELRTAIVGDRRYEAPEETKQGVALRVDFVASLQEQLDPGEHEEGTEDVDDPVESLQERRTEHDEDGPHDERAEDPPEEHAVLKLGRDRER